MGNLNSTFIKFLNKVQKCSLKNEKDWFPADAMAAAIILWHHLATAEIVVNIRAVMTGEAQGSLLVDYHNKTKEIQNTRIVDMLDNVTFLDILINYFQKDMRS